MASRTTRGTQYQAAVASATTEELMQEIEATSSITRVGSKPKVALLLMFTASWCGPCKLMADEMRKLEQRRKGKVKVMYLDVDANKDLATRLNIKALPTTIFVGHAEPSKPVISAHGIVKVKLMEDILDNKLHIAGSDLQKRLKLY